MNDIKQRKASNKYGWKLDNSYSKLPTSFYTPINPTPVREPKRILFNSSLAMELELDLEALESEHGIAILAGCTVPAGSIPIAQAYAGHQFGYFNMLGDGRTMLLGEQVTSKNIRFDIQLKGSGRTPYSRGGDGRAALGPMLREYIISEAMHGLGIPTTRSLAVVTTGEAVLRETKLVGAVLTRVSSSHIRVATFQYALHYGSIEDLKALADYTIKRHFPEIEMNSHCYLSLLEGVIKRQAELIAKWQLVGFVHGVMNTDNMAISGETIDYGPCAFMDTYDPNTAFSSIDTNGRYTYGNQPNIAIWNLSRFAETLLPLLDNNKENAIHLAQEALSKFKVVYYSNWLSGMKAKLGLFNDELQDEDLIESLLKIMYKYGADYTNTFLALTFDNYLEVKNQKMYASKEFLDWKEQWKIRQDRQSHTIEERVQLMKSSNPSLIPRNHIVEAVILDAVSNKGYSALEGLLSVLLNPYQHSKEQKMYSIVPEDTLKPYVTYCGT